MTDEPKYHLTLHMMKALDEYIGSVETVDIPYIFLELLAIAFKFAKDFDCPDRAYINAVCAGMESLEVGKGRINWSKLSNDLIEKAEE